MKFSSLLKNSNESLETNYWTCGTKSICQNEWMKDKLNTNIQIWGVITEFTNRPFEKKGRGYLFSQNHRADSVFVYYHRLLVYKT